MESRTDPRASELNSPGSPVQKLDLPLGDLVDMNVELLSQLGQRLVASDSGHRHLRLEGWYAWVPAGSSRQVSPARHASQPLSGGNSTYPAVQIS
jgi:hypothetical protein